MRFCSGATHLHYQAVFISGLNDGYILCGFLDQNFEFNGGLLFVPAYRLFIVRMFLGIFWFFVLPSVVRYQPFEMLI